MKPSSRDDLPTLVVVDMQDGMEASKNKPTKEAVRQLILFAASKGWAIVFLEYDWNKLVETYPFLKDKVLDFGRTHADLISLVEGYSRVSIELKPDKDGSEAVLLACKSGKFSTGRFVVCGVNLDACVVFTANGLARLFPQSPIDVVLEACHSDNPQMWETWNSFVAHETINVVSMEQTTVS